MLALVRGRCRLDLSHLGVDGCLAVVERAHWRRQLREAQARVTTRGRSCAESPTLLMAGGRLSRAEEDAVRIAVEQRGLGASQTCTSGNDTPRRPSCRHGARVGRRDHVRRWNQLRGCWRRMEGTHVSGTRRDHGRLGRGLRPGLMAAVSAAARSEDGRGPRTSLERAVPAHFGADHAERARRRDSHRADRTSAVSSSSRRWCWRKLRTTRSRRRSSRTSRPRWSHSARVALTRLELTQEPVEVLLGGGVLQDVDGDLLGRRSVPACARPPRTSPSGRPRPPAIVGAALLGLDELEAGPEAQARLAPRARGGVFPAGRGAQTVG